LARLHEAIPPPRLSVLDRLLDDDPETPGPETPDDYATGLSRLRASVLRDLQWLLNARTAGAPTRGASPDRDPDPLEGTVLRLGLPDITNLDLKNARARESLRRLIADVIERFEPRLDFVTVHVHEGDERLGRTRFHVEGRLRVDPEPLKLSFDATVVWRNRTVEVS
jgi:type VI secretion system protein ImpF